MWEKSKSSLGKHKLVLRYIITGVAASLSDLLLLFVLTEYFHWHYLISAIGALSFSFTSAFFIQKYWTFADYSDHNIHGQFFSYFFTVFTSMALNLLLLSVFVELVRLNYLLAQMISLCITGVFGFVMNVRSVFRRISVDNGIVIAAGIFPPDIGGPASHIQKLASEFAARGVNVYVVTYSKTQKSNPEDEFDVTRISAGLPAILRGLSYLTILFTSSVRHNNIFAQDITSTGLPALIVKKLLPHKRLVIRIGGDLLWERKFESGETKLPLVEYYKSGIYLKEPLFKIGRYVMSVADQIIAPAEFLKDIYVNYYGISQDKIVVIKNPLPSDLQNLEVEPSKKIDTGKTIIFAGRFLKLKNLERLIDAFASIYEEIKPARLLLVGEGAERGRLMEVVRVKGLGDRIQVLHTLPRSELMREIAGADLCVCPSTSEVNSNFTLECLVVGKPVLLTKNNGLSIDLPAEMLIDPEKTEDLADKMRALVFGGYDPAEVARLATEGSAKNSWKSVLAEYSRIFNF